MNTTEPWGAHLRRKKIKRNQRMKHTKKGRGTQKEEKRSEFQEETGLRHQTEQSRESEL